MLFQLITHEKDKVFMPNIPALSLKEGITAPQLKEAWDLIKTDCSVEILRLLDEYPPGLETKSYRYFCYGRALKRPKTLW